MARSKYPGFQILYEVGSRAELAKSYGVSERTMYRWLNKARAQTKERQEYPGAKVIARFKGTRKQLAARYNISERTAYRWINKAKAEGAEIESRQKKSKYPGAAILEETGTNKTIGDRFGVSEATIRRWKNRAKSEAESLGTEEPENIFEEPEETFKQPDVDFEEPEEEPKTEAGAEEEDPTAKLLFDLLEENEQLVEDSIFYTLDRETQLNYLNAYIQYQDDQNHKLFYNPDIHDFDYSPEFVSTINIWGDEFETWLKREQELEDFSTDWMDNLGI